MGPEKGVLLSQLWLLGVFFLSLILVHDGVRPILVHKAVFASHASPVHLPWGGAVLGVGAAVLGSVRRGAGTGWNRPLRCPQ